MSDILKKLSDNPGARISKKRISRGIGSGKGKTGGRGIKGQKARSGVAIYGFEGGQMPIHRRLPKRGFNNSSRREIEALNLSKLQTFIDEGKLDAKEITVKNLIASGIVRGNKDGIKLLAKGDIKSVISITIEFASRAAISAVEAVGGKVIISEKKKIISPEKKKKSTSVKSK